MKVIDLYNRTFSRDKMPKKIKFKGHIFELYKYLDNGLVMYDYGSTNSYTNLLDYVKTTSDLLLNDVIVFEEKEELLHNRLYFHDLENITDNEKILVNAINLLQQEIEDIKK